MKLALGFNPILPFGEAASVAGRAERAGYDSVWMHESLFQRDVVTYISSMVSATKSIRIGSGVINTFTRHPVTAAATFASLSELSGGRVVLGLGLGSFPTVPLLGYQIFPVEKTRPLKRITEYVKVVKEVWKGGKVDFDGEFFKVRGLTMGFELKSPVPIFVASLSPRTQRFAASVADGVILSPGLNTVWGTERMVANVKAGEEASGRSVERASYMMASLDPDPQKARDAVRDYYFFVYQLSDVVRPEVLAPYGVSEEALRPMKEAYRKGDLPGAKKLVPAEAIEALTVCGGADHAAERIDEYRKAGVTLPILMPIGNVDYAVQALSPARS
ncbi:MAG TPA: LLM class flavin-dependent oxidoreductase [Nitrososphaerales archaeon]|nr:LLM class flavin-dependent oxidoreductase [Nitrososphaerales archaeon]